MPERAGRVGPGRILVLVYGFFALAAGARSAVQVSLHFDRAPLAYCLSALAAACYLAGAVLLRTVEAGDGRLRRIAQLLCLVELVGVVTVGTASLRWPASFPDPTVWSGYGLGYGFVPALLPFLAFGWLRRSAAETARDRVVGGC